MKPITKLLVAVLVVSTLMPLAAAMKALLDPDSLMGFFRISVGPGDEAGVTAVRTLSTFFGITLTYVVGVGITSIVWIVQRKAEGIVLAKLLGILTIISGVLIYAKVGATDFSGIDVVKGVVITGLAFAASNDSRRRN